MAESIIINGIDKMSLQHVQHQPENVALNFALNFDLQGKIF